jgi:polyhydroxyalkanoate synthesis regulator phasin
MNRFKRLLQTTTRTQHARKAPLTVASLALIATCSISAISFDASAGEPAPGTNRSTPTDYTVSTFVKITDALMAGTITPEEAAKKIQATNRVNTYLTKVETDISVAVESGKMTVDEGMEKYDAAVKNINKRMGGGNSKSMTKEEYEQGVSKMVEMVKTGEITREQMEARLNRMKKAMGGEKGKTNDRAQAYLKKIGIELREAVANGDMTAEEGKARYAEAEAKIQQRMGKSQGNSDDRFQVYLTKIGTELRQSVTDGEMTPEDAKAKYLEVVEQMKLRIASKNDANKDGAGRGGNRGKGGGNSSGRGK